MTFSRQLLKWVGFGDSLLVMLTPKIKGQKNGVWGKGAKRAVPTKTARFDHEIFLLGSSDGTTELRLQNALNNCTTTCCPWVRKIYSAFRVQLSREKTINQKLNKKLNKPK